MQAIYQGVLNGVGYTPALAAELEALVLVNEYIFIPALQKADVSVTKAIWG
jgi:hypothetical protein